MTHVSAARYWRARSEPYLRVPLDVLEWSGSLVRAVWLGQAVFWATRAADAEGWVDKTVQDFEDFTTLGKTAQHNVKKWLKDEGLLETKTKGLPRRTLWRLDLDRLAELVEECQVSGDHTPSCGSRDEPQEVREANRIPIPEGTEEEGSTPAGCSSPPGTLFEGEQKKAQKAKGYSPSFEAFWRTASRAWKASGKVPGSKADAFRAWKATQADRRPSGEQAQAWLDGYHRAERSGVFPGGVQHLCRWLKAERWEDEWPEGPQDGWDGESWEAQAREQEAETRRMLEDQRNA